MRRAIAGLVAAGALVGAGTAAAHPLGNFTVNRYSRVQPSGDRVYVLYVLDLAEIPTFQARGEVERDGAAAYGARLARAIAHGAHLTVGGRAVPLHAEEHVLAFPPGQAGLRTTRLEALLASPPLLSTKTRLAYRDGNFEGRIGWKEIVLEAGSGARVLRSTVPASSVSDELLAYPKDLLQSPPDVTRARALVALGHGSGRPPGLIPRSVLERRAAVRAVADGGFAGLVARRHLSAGVILLSLVLALVWGAAHALTPGHGKAVVAAYLVGQRGTPRHAVLLGGVVTLTHTAGVFALGLVTLLLSRFVLPDTLYPWLNLIAGLMVVTIGLSVLWARLGPGLGHRLAHTLHRDHTHAHHHQHGHRHDLPRELSARSLVTVGVSGGILPCPSALVVLLAAISLHRVGFGLILIVAFSLGLALTVTAIGLTAVLARRAFTRMSLGGPVLGLLPAVSAFVIVAAGVAMTVRALPTVT